MQTRMIADVPVSAIGLGAMHLSLARRPQEAQAIATVHAALDAGVTLIDTADAYCIDEDDIGHNERLLARALQSWNGDRDAVLVATKGGHTRPGGAWRVNGRPEYLRQACERSLRALDTEPIGLYQFHRPDPEIPFYESVGALVELREEGKIRLIGVSNASKKQIKEAMAVADLASVQNEFSPRFRSSAEELAFCAEQGIAFLSYSPLGGVNDAKQLGRQHAAFSDVADSHGVSPQQVALAWQLAKAQAVIPIPGASRPETILDSLQAVDLVLSDAEIVRLDAAETSS